MKTNVSGFIGACILLSSVFLGIFAADSRNYTGSETIDFGWGQIAKIEQHGTISAVGCDYFIASNGQGTVIEGRAQDPSVIPLGWPCENRYVVENMPIVAGVYKIYEGTNTTAKIVSENPNININVRSSNPIGRVAVAFVIALFGVILLVPWITRESTKS